MANWLASITAQAQNLGANLTENVTRMAHEIQENIQQIDLGSVTETVKNAENDIISEQNRIEAEDAARALREVKILPWETTDESKSILTHPVMEKVLGLSLEQSNFTTPPPSDAAYTFSLDQHAAVAMRVLEIDPNLSRTHAKLVSKLREEVFWRNYFFRVEHIRAEAGLEQLAAGRQSYGSSGGGGGGGGSSAHGAPSDVSTTDGFERVTMADARSATADGAVVAAGAAAAAAGPGAVAEDDSDDSALEAAVAAELGEDGLGDDFDDLGDLDDLVDDAKGEGDGGGGGGGGGEDADADAELEAQIARELEETG